MTISAEECEFRKTFKITRQTHTYIHFILYLKKDLLLQFSVLRFTHEQQQCIRFLLSEEQIILVCNTISTFKFLLKNKFKIYF